jgi:hypothetical protein
VRFTAAQTVLGETSSSIVEMDLFGNVVHTLDAGSDYSAGLHHDINTYDGVYYGLELYQHTTEPNGGAQLDAVVTLDQETGEEVARFWPDEHFDIPTDATGDWLHTNTVSIDEKGDLYLSYLAQNTLVKVRGLPGGADFGTPLWVIEGQNGGLEKTLDLDWTNIGGNDLFGFQHSLSLRADGRIMVLDNTNGRALVITIDEAEGRAVVDAAFDTVESSCGPQGTAQETATGNVLAGCSGGNIREYEIGTGDLLWEASVTCRDGASPYAVRWYALDGWLQ